MCTRFILSSHSTFSRMLPNPERMKVFSSPFSEKEKALTVVMMMINDHDDGAHNLK
jgi:hypothetical protein